MFLIAVANFVFPVLCNVVQLALSFVDSDPIRLVPPPTGSESPNTRAHLFEQVRPHEGELVKTVAHNRVQPWVADVDKVWGTSATGVGGSPWKALRILFENEELYGSPQDS